MTTGLKMDEGGQPAKKAPSKYPARPPPEIHSIDDRSCFLCAKTDSLERCPECANVWFCSEEHFEVHRPKGKCFPFIIKRSPTKGRWEILHCVQDIVTTSVMVTIT